MSRGHLRLYTEILPLLVLSQKFGNFSGPNAAFSKLLFVIQVDSVTLSGLLIRCYACTSYLVTHSWLPPWSGPMWCLVFGVRSGLRPNMVSPNGPEVRGRILQLDALKHNNFSILYHLSLKNVIVCERTVRRVLKTAREAGTKPQQQIQELPRNARPRQCFLQRSSKKSSAGPPREIHHSRGTWHD